MGATMAYRVTAPYVTVQVVAVAGGPPTTLGFYAGAVLPANVDRESAELQVRKGLVEKVSADEVSAAEEPAESQAPAGPQRPAKNASKAAWVAFAVTQRAEDVDEETARADAEALTQTQLVAKYGS